VPKYQDDVIEARKADHDRYDALIKTGRLSASVGWPTSMLRADIAIHLALAELGVHHIHKKVCNCGLIVTRYPNTGHRDHKTKELITRAFHITTKLGSNY
jgi:hypothetical protein